MTAGLLLERDGELTSVARMLDRARAGSGGTVVVQGPAGIGKTSLLEMAVEAADERSFRVLRACPGPVERDLAWSVARDLLASTVLTLSEDDRALAMSGAALLSAGPLGLDEGNVAAVKGPMPDVAAPLYGMYWLCSNLAQVAPVLVVVDDAHWADPPSSRFLAYLAQRAADLPLLLAVALRSGEPTNRYLRGLGQRADVLSPGPLSAGAGAVVVRTWAGEWAGDEMCRACQEATGGNPLLLEELAKHLARLGPEAQPEQVAHLKPATVTRTVLLRLARLPVAARQLALAATVLGRVGNLTAAASLVGMSRTEAARAHDLLVEADIMANGPGFEVAHPLVGDIIYAESPPGARSELHYAAARLHDAAADPVGDVAAHLLGTLPGRDGWVVDRLREGAQAAMPRSAPGVAVSYLRRALAEQVGPAPVGLLVELGLAEATVSVPGAIDHLLEACRRADGPVERADIVLLLAPLLVLEGRLAEAAALCSQSLDEVGESDAEAKLRLVANIVSAGLLAQELHPAAASALSRLEELPRGSTPGQRFALAVASRAGPAPEGGYLCPRDAVSAGVLARRALGGGLLLSEVGPESPVYWYAATGLVFPGWYEEAAEAIEGGMAEARRRGSVLGFALASCFRSQLYYRQGRLADSIADTRQALDAAALDASAVLRAYATAFLVNSLVDAGAEDEAATALEAFAVPGPRPRLFAFALVEVSAALLAIARGFAGAGAEALLRAGPAVDAHGTAAVTPWRAPAALALAAAGQRDRARSLAAEGLILARAARSPWALSVSLRASGVVEEDASLLGQAVAVAAEAGAPLEEARALLDLGALHRRAGARRLARTFLGPALQKADYCGAGALVRQADRELGMCGGRRPGRQRSPFGLTPSEQRVADMALTGLTNPEIAQALFVSLRTVETHLTHVYRKLGIDSRRQLWPALSKDGEVGLRPAPLGSGARS